MVVYCVAFGCKNLHNKTDSVHFHRFPFKRPGIMKLWLNAIRRDKWEPSASSRLCSVHFKESDYLITPGSSRKVLKQDAVPSDFNFPKHLAKEASSRHCSKRVLLQTVKEEETENTEVSMETDEQSSRLCSEHFKELDYLITPGSSRKVLKQDGVPSDFYFRKHLVKEASSRHCSKTVLLQTVKEENSENTEVSMDQHTEGMTKGTNDAQTQTYEYFQSSVREYSQQRTIKSLKQKIRRIELKLNNMQTLILELKNSNCTTDEIWGAEKYKF